ncbi:unnamed protein product, partial [Urochloa humidicola]
AAQVGGAAPVSGLLPFPAGGWLVWGSDPTKGGGWPISRPAVSGAHRGIRSDFCWLWCWLAEVCLLLVGLTRPGTKKRKRTKKGAVKAGRKKSKKDAPSAPEITTPRTRAVAAREAANAAIAAAKEAEALAIAAANEAEASASNQAPTLSTKRRLALEEDPPTLEALLPAPAKKMTPRKKQLATKVKKATKSKSPAKK